MSGALITHKHLELDALLDMTNAINRQMDEPSLLKIFMFTLVANFRIDKVVVIEMDPVPKFLLRHGTKDEEMPTKEVLYLAESQGVITKDQHPDIPFDFLIYISQKDSLKACIGLSGMHQLWNASQQEKIKFIHTLSNILIVALANTRMTAQRIVQEALKKELETAKKIQSMLFPSKLPYSDTVQIHATYIPHQSIGGDYFDYIRINDNEFFLCIADVSGKGIAAAMVMSNFQAALRILVRQGFSISKIIHELNQIVYTNTGGEKFVTAFFAYYNLQTNQLIYVNAGHNTPFMLQSNNEIASLDKGCTLLGVFERLPSMEVGVIFGVSASILYMYTDGLVEGPHLSDTAQGEEIIQELMRAQRHAPGLLEPSPSTLEKKELHISINDSNLHKKSLELLYRQEDAPDDITLLTCIIP